MPPKGRTQLLEQLLERELGKVSQAGTDILGLAPTAAQELLARSLPYYQALAAATGRPSDPALQEAARRYVAAADTQEWARSAGYGGQPRLQGADSVLAAIARDCFPGYSKLDEDGRADLLERIKRAAKYQRSKTRGEF